MPRALHNCKLGDFCCYIDLLYGCGSGASVGLSRFDAPTKRIEGLYQHSNRVQLLALWLHGHARCVRVCCVQICDVIGGVPQTESLYHYFKLHSCYYIQLLHSFVLLCVLSCILSLAFSLLLSLA